MTEDISTSVPSKSVKTSKSKKKSENVQKKSENFQKKSKKTEDDSENFQTKSEKFQKETENFEMNSEKVQSNSDNVQKKSKKTEKTSEKQVPDRAPGFDLEGNEDQTVFLRNLPFEAGEQDITEALQKYGSIKWVKIVKDKLTKIPKGTAFVRFADVNGANACIEEEARAQEVLVRNKKSKMPEIEGLEGLGLNILGRRVIPSRALKG
jgi:nucleolar protein 4